MCAGAEKNSPFFNVVTGNYSIGATAVILYSVVQCNLPEGFVEAEVLGAEVRPGRDGIFALI